MAFEALSAPFVGGWRPVRLMYRDRVRAPTVLQMEALECGAASLAMILAYHGRWVPIEELRLRCGVSRDGTKASNILKAARHYGLNAKGVRLEPADLATLRLPAVLHWNFCHFVVLEGIRGKTAYLKDPAFGARRVPVAEVEESFTGVALVFEPGPDFVRGGTRPAFWTVIAGELDGSRQAVMLAALLSLVLVLPGIATPLFAKIFIDQILLQHLHGWLRPLLLGMAAMALFRGGVGWLRDRQLARLEAKLAILLSARLLWRMFDLPIDFFLQRHAGDLASRVEAADDVARLLSGGLAVAFLSIPASLLFAILMILIDPPLAAIAILAALVNALVLRLVASERESLAHWLYKERSLLAAATVAAVRSIETIKASGLEQDAFARWAGFHAKQLGAERRVDAINATLGLFPTLIAALGMVALIGVGARQVIAGETTVGGLVAFTVLFAAFFEPIARVANLSGDLQDARAALARVTDISAHPLDRRSGLDDEVGKIVPALPARLSGRVTLSKVSFGYGALDPPLIVDFDLDVRPGARVALVGASGSGKSTIARLVAGLVEPWSGEISFDGLRIGELPHSYLANSLSYVDQDVFLFEGSIADNVTLWDGSTSDLAITLALQDACIFDDIAQRQGLASAPVAEGGFNFSGGQRQRLEIARALVTDPSILILDEATAALDPVVERQVDDNLRRRGCTCIIVAHRLSTIRDCDEIIMLEHGRVIARGTHDALIATCPAYAAMLNV